MNGQCVILAGGMGARMKSVANGLPPSLMAIRNRPFLHYQLSSLAKQEIRDVVLCVGFGAEPIERYAEDGRLWGLHIRYVKEGADLRGTGGALRLAYDEGVLDPVFFVMNGNSFLPIDFKVIWEYFDTRMEPALMVLMRSEGRRDRSNAAFDGQKVTRYDKKSLTPDMAYVDSGLAVMKTSAVEDGIPPKSPYDLADLYAKISARGKLAGFEVQTPIYEIGSPEGLKDLTEHL
jgi:NDP-sugar pyrophosphorylase family protein